MMKKLKCLGSGLLAVIILFSALVPHVAQATDNEVSNVEINFEDYEVKTQGLVMSPEEFNNAFGGEPESRFMPFNLVSTELTMHNIVIDGSDISLDLVLSPANLFGTIVDVEYSAYVTRLNGNQNDLTINVVEHFEGGWTNELSETFRIDNNGSGTFELGNYQIFVSTRGNDRIREIRLESDGTKVLPVRGTIYNGNRNGAIVVYVPDFINGYEVLLIEINMTPETHNLLLPESHQEGLYGRAHVKVYLMNMDGQIYLFENEIPEAFLTLHENDFEELNNHSDLSWARDFIEGEYREYSEDEVTLELLEALGLSDDYGYSGFVPFGLGSFSTVMYGSGVFTYTYIAGRERFRYNSRPQMRHRRNNIGRNATNDFDVEFRIAEAFIQEWTDGTHIQSLVGTGFWNYRQVEAAVQLGNHTHINHFTTHGRMVRHNGISSSARAAGNAVSTRIMTAAGIPTSAQAALDAVRAAANAAHTNVTLGPNGVYRRTARTTRAGRRMGSEYRLHHNTGSTNGHHLHIAANAGRWQEGVAGQNSVTQHGAVRIAFYVYRQNRRHGNERRSINTSFTYTIDRRP